VPREAHDVSHAFTPSSCWRGRALLIFRFSRAFVKRRFVNLDVVLLSPGNACSFTRNQFEWLLKRQWGDCEARKARAQSAPLFAPGLCVPGKVNPLTPTAATMRGRMQSLALAPSVHCGR